MEHRRTGRGQLRLLRDGGSARAPRARRPHDVAAQQRALAVLCDDPEGRYSWLCDPATQVIRVGILAELGRVEDDGELDLVVHVVYVRRGDDRRAVADERGERLEEEGGGLGRLQFQLGGVVGVVERQADHLRRRDGRQPGDCLIVDRAPRLVEQLPLGGDRALVDAPGGEEPRVPHYVTPGASATAPVAEKSRACLIAPPHSQVEGRQVVWCPRR